MSTSVPEIRIKKFSKCRLDCYRDRTGAIERKATLAVAPVRLQKGI
jgi:hypothetical protein